MQKQIKNQITPRRYHNESFNDDDECDEPYIDVNEICSNHRDKGNGKKGTTDTGNTQFVVKEDDDLYLTPISLSNNNVSTDNDNIYLQPDGCINEQFDEGGYLVLSDELAVYELPTGTEECRNIACEPKLDHMITQESPYTYVAPNI